MNKQYIEGITWRHNMAATLESKATEATFEKVISFGRQK